jgi:hypothetical protein
VAAKEKIEVTYIPSDAEKSKRKFDAGVRNPKKVEILVNGVLISKTAWKVDLEGNLVFQEPPPHEAVIEFRYVTEERCDFRHALEGRIVPGSVEIRDAETGAIVPGGLDAGEIKVSKDDAKETKKIHVTAARELDADVAYFQLPSRPAFKTTVAKVDGAICELEVSAESIAHVLCPVSSQSKVQFRYSEDAEVEQRTYSLGAALKGPEALVWKVLVDGKAATIERFDSFSFVLQDPPPAGALIKLILTPKG